MDSHWREHLAALDYLRQGIHLRGYAQKNPKQEYKREAFELFSQLLDVVKMEVTRLLMTVRIQSQEQVAQAAEEIEERASQVGNVTYTHPNEDGSVSNEADVATAVAAAMRPGCGQGRPQRALPLRQRQEVQELPRQAGLRKDTSMPVNLVAPDPAQLHPVRGVEIGIAMAGVRKANRRDVTVVQLAEGSSVAGVFTANRFCAAPVLLCREHLAAGKGIRAILVNTGNANAGTGADGLARARSTCAALGDTARHRARAGAALFHRRDHGDAAARAHRSRAAGGDGRCRAEPLGAGGRSHHDHRHAAQGSVAPAAAGRQDGERSPASAKGAGMIRPNMATMLGFIATDAAIAPGVDAVAGEGRRRPVLQPHHHRRRHLDQRFLRAHRHAPGGQCTDHGLDGGDGALLREAVIDVAQQLAQAIVRDGEGATKFITVQVDGGRDVVECRKVAYAIAHSPLVKTAFFASDPNLGRILAAVGYAGIDDLDQGLIDLFLDDVHVAMHGARHPAYDEEQGQRVMKQSRDHGARRPAPRHRSATVWTCDLSHDYVSINADYRS